MLMTAVQDLFIVCKSTQFIKVRVINTNFELDNNTTCFNKKYSVKNMSVTYVKMKMEHIFKIYDMLHMINRIIEIS